MGQKGYLERDRKGTLSGSVQEVRASLRYSLPGMPISSRPNPPPPPPPDPGRNMQSDSKATGLFLGKYYSLQNKIGLKQMYEAQRFTSKKLYSFTAARSIENINDRVEK